MNNYPKRERLTSLSWRGKPITGEKKVDMYTDKGDTQDSWDSMV